MSRSATHPPASRSLADRLKSATAEHHRRAESRPLQRAMASGTIERATYARWSVAMLALHAALESRLRGLVATRGGGGGLLELVAGHQRHVLALQKDVTRSADAGRLAAGCTPGNAADRAGPATRAAIDALGRAADQVPISALGALYVLEGSMNGNRFIASRLRDAWGDAEDATYLDPDGDEQRPRWLRWRAGLDALPLLDVECDAIERAAAAMFDAVTALSDEVAEVAKPEDGD